MITTTWTNEDLKGDDKGSHGPSESQIKKANKRTFLHAEAMEIQRQISTLTMAEAMQLAQIRISQREGK